MSFLNCASRNSQNLLVLGFLLLVRSVVCHEHKAGSYNLGSIMEPLDGLREYVESIVGTHALQIGFEVCFLTAFVFIFLSVCGKGFTTNPKESEQTCDSSCIKKLCNVYNAVLHLDSVFGPENVYSVAMFVEMLLKFVAEGAASGLNVIAVYVSEILRATGVNESISIPHFTTEGVSAVIKWALLALTGYSILSLVLRVTVALVRRVFWLVKVILVLWLFVRIVSDPSTSTELIGMRLTLLVLICAVFGIVTSSAGGTGAGLEERVGRLEGQFKMEKKKTE